MFLNNLIFWQINWQEFLTKIIHITKLVVALSEQVVHPQKLEAYIVPAMIVF